MYTEILSEKQQELLSFISQFYKDIDYSEEVEYMDGRAVSQEEVKAFLIEQSLSLI